MALELQSVVDTEVVAAGAGLRRKLQLKAGLAQRLDLPAAWIGQTERLEVLARKGATPADVSGEADRRPLGVRIRLVHKAP